VPIQIEHLVVFIAETPRPQRIAENIVNTSALLRELCVSALRTNNKGNATLIVRPGTRISSFDSSLPKTTKTLLQLRMEDPS